MSVAAKLLELGVAVDANGPAEQRVPCPRCDRGPRDDAMGANIETGVLHCFRCGWSGRAGSGDTHAGGGIVRIDDPRRAERVRKRLRDIWHTTVPLGEEAARAVQTYLHARGLGQVLLSPPAVLRAHPALAYFDTTGRELGKWPAMVALFANRDGDRCTVHATYLRADGSAKAPVANPKKVLGVPARGATKGGAIRLYQPQVGRLGIAEGIESALSLGLIRRIPVWSSYCADNLVTVRLPPRLRELEIGVDVDDNHKGEAAARALAARVLRNRPGLTVRLIMPDGDGPRDLNDELQPRPG